MINHQMGYVIELAEHNLTEKKFRFTTYKISIQKSNMQESKLEPLFEFDIPEQFIIGMSKERFYESLYPLLPCYQEDEIYFTSFDKLSEKFKLYVYNQNSKLISMYPISKGLHDKHIFAPLLVQNKVHFGQSL
jgi:hypothetical protein